MALTPRLDLRQSQQLVMTPQLQQAIKLLQLTNLELADYVAQEVERNPLLEVGDPNEGPIVHETGEGGGTASDEFMREGGEAGGDGSDGLVASDRSMESGVDTSSGSDSALDADYETNVYNGDAVSDRIGEGASGSLSYDGSGAVKGGGGFDDRGLDQTLEGEENLHDFLLRQMAVALHAPAERLIATHLIDLVDDAGYIRTEDVADVAPLLGSEPEDVDHVLGVLQTLEPSGVFARTLGECLAIQLRELDRYDPAMQALIENLDLLAKRDMAAIKQTLNDEQWARFNEPVAVELKAGECVFHHPLTINGSFENRTERPRRAMVLNVVKDGVQSASNEPLLQGTEIIPAGEPLGGQFYPLLFDANSAT